jgi:hypothetical protein
MKGLKFSKETSMASLVFFTIYALYGAFRIPFMQYIICLLAGAIAYAITSSYEMGLIALLSVNFLYTLTMVCFRPREGYENEEKSKILGRLQNMGSSAGIAGVGSQMSEGFADASGNEGMGNEETPNTGDVTAKSKPAPALKAEDSVEKFEGSKDLFKLGSLPSEGKGDLKLDGASTMVKALNALKPEQIEAMTQDTKQLMETQKNLMDMLKTFTPIVQEGRQMMDTFNGMFGPSAGAATKA